MVPGRNGARTRGGPWRRALPDRDFSIPRLKNPGFTLVNLAANHDVDERWSVFGRIDNLFDKRYENPTGFLGPGLAVYGGVRLNSF